MPKLAAIILAAGKGVRMASKRAKVLHPIAGQPMLFYPLVAAQELGAQPLVCVVGHGRTEVKAAVADRFPHLKLVHQKKQLGTAHAVLCAESALKAYEGDVLIMTGDAPFLKPATLTSFIEYHCQGKYGQSLLTALLDNPTGYGRIVRGPNGRALRIVEENDLASETERAIREINAGIYLVKKALLFSALRKVNKNPRKGEFYLTDLTQLSVQAGEAVGTLCVADPTEVMGINSRAELALAGRIVRERINRAWMERGVTFLDPETALIDQAVTLERDVTIGPHVGLHGRTVVKSGTQIGAGVVIEDSVIESDVKILPYTVIESSHVEAEAQVGPFAHLRPNSRVGRGAKVGNFVELKQTHLKAGAKANHLSYLGDTVIGAESNIGAGTITCNYDGKAKYQTTIGAHCFIGSDTQLVAPVKLGAGSYVGAGTTVTQNVPAGALALSRTKQVNIKGWTKKKRREN